MVSVSRVSRKFWITEALPRTNVDRFGRSTTTSRTHLAVPLPVQHLESDTWVLQSSIPDTASWRTVSLRWARKSDWERALSLSPTMTVRYEQRYGCTIQAAVCWILDSLMLDHRRRVSRFVVNWFAQLMFCLHSWLTLSFSKTWQRLCSNWQPQTEWWLCVPRSSESAWSG